MSRWPCHRALDSGLPVLPLPGPGGASGALGQESGRTEADPPARWCRGLGSRVRKEKSEETTRQLRAKSNNRKRYLGACLAAQGCPQSPLCLCRGPTCSDRPAPAPCRRLPDHCPPSLAPSHTRASLRLATPTAHQLPGPSGRDGQVTEAALEDPARLTLPRATAPCSFLLGEGTSLAPFLHAFAL